MGKKSKPKSVKSAKKPSTPIKKKVAVSRTPIKPVGNKMGLTSKINQMSTTKKIGLGVGALALGVGAVAVGKKFFGKRKRNQTQKLKAKIIRKQLKIKNIQLDRKLLKEQLKGVL